MNLGLIHSSDCALHNEPALPAGPCSCGLERLASVALAMWEAREKCLEPAFVRRMKPDEIDHASGSWGMMVAMASAAIKAADEHVPSPPPRGVVG